MNREKQFILMAIQEAKKSDHKQKIGAIIFKGKRVISVGHNYSSRSVRSVTKRFCRWETSVHAEVSCILNAKRDLKGYNILVIRINNQGKLMLAKPCKYCLAYLNHVQIKYCYYSDNGKIKKMKISEEEIYI